MAERRMIAKAIIDADAFLDMPASAQNLYFHLLLRADDDGFVKTPKAIRRSIGASDDDIKLLLAKNYILAFDSGAIVIKHWRIHNYIRKDRYKPTICAVEARQLLIDETGEYILDCQPMVAQLATIGQPTDNQLATIGQPTDNQLATIGQPLVDPGKVSIGKVRLGKVSIEKEREVQSRVTITPPIPPLTGGKSESEKNSDDIIGEGPKVEECEPPKREQPKTREPPKTKYAEFVSMTEEEHSRLVEEYGEDGTAECIAILDNYKGSTGKRYKSDYRAILSWVVERYKERHMARPIARPKQQRDLSEILQELRGGQHED